MGLSKRSLALGASALVGASIIATGAGVRLSKSWAVFQPSPKETVDEVWQVINSDYVDGTFNGLDWRKVRTQYLNRTYPSQKEAYSAIREMLEKLGDPYTRFLDPEQFKSMKIDTSGELTGVGIQIAQDEKTKEIKIIAPIDGSPASKAGLLAKDVLLKVGDKATKGMDINEVVALIRGPVNTNVTLTILRGGQTKVFNLKRERIELKAVRSSVKTSSAGPIGYIRLSQFSSHAPDEMRKAIRELSQKNVAGFILDLRSNPGGLLHASTEIARMWINDAPIVSTVDRRGISERVTAGRSSLTDKPLVVLVDGGSASASEILSGALQEDDRAVLVGTKTFGKGLVQSVRPLGDGSGMAVTIAKYFTPSGRDINKKGIEPDYKVELTEAQIKAITPDIIGTDRDLQYAKALSVLNQQIASGQKLPLKSEEPKPPSKSS
ncbi:MAG: S41 family peptidase [Thermosynechococcaceae cyanobacterium MS004]|nr:S41 family peptidase [Thermosynechococcaceae cyanobacterium MS004]